MKTLKNLFVVVALIASSLVSGQEINFNASTQLLIPQEDYLPKADWAGLFYDDTQTSAVTKYGIKKPVVFAPDGSVFISDRYTNRITKLDPTGRVVTEFGKRGWNPGEFVNNQDIHGILDDQYLVISDAQGRINFFDLNGRFVKMITIDFMPLNIYPMKNGKLIIQGHVPYGTKSKKLLAELDFETEKYIQIDYTFIDYDDPSYGIRIEGKEGGTMSVGPPFSSRRSVYRTTSDGKVIIAENNTGNVNVYKPAGGTYQKSEFELQSERIPITQKEKDEYYEKFRDRLLAKGLDASLADKMKTPGYFPDYLPFFYNVVVDNQDNCLFFVYSNQDKDFLFRAYSTEGKFLGESEFKIEGYDLLANLGNFKFIDGYVYTLALKHDEKMPMRLIKCKIVPQQ